MTLDVTSLPVPEGVTIFEAAGQAALGVVEAYCGWSLLADSYDLTLDSDGGTVLALPSLHVTDVLAVTLLGVDASGNPLPQLVQGVNYDWRQNGTLSRIDGCGWPNRGQSVHVSYQGGFVDLPMGVSAVVASIAERIDLGGTVQSRLENVGGIQQSITFAQSATAGTGLTSIECAVLDRWRIAVAR